MRYRLTWLFVVVFVGALVSLFLSSYVFVPEIGKSNFPVVDGAGIAGGFLDLGVNGRDRLYFRYGRHYDSGVEVERVTAGKTVWRIFSDDHGAEHSKYKHDVQLSVSGNIVTIRSVGPFGVVTEKRDIKDGKLLGRSMK